MSGLGESRIKSTVQASAQLPPIPVCKNAESFRFAFICKFMYITLRHTFDCMAVLYGQNCLVEGNREPEAPVRDSTAA